MVAFFLILNTSEDDHCAKNITEHTDLILPITIVVDIIHDNKDMSISLLVSHYVTDRAACLLHAKLQVSLVTFQSQLYLLEL